MAPLSDSPGRLSLLPLTVAVDGVQYRLTPVFEPLYAPGGRLVAVEVLSRLSRLDDPKVTLDPSHFFAWATVAEAWRVFAWQTGVLARCRPWCAAHGVLVTLNINRAQARGCLAHGDVLDQLAALAPWLRLEINEHFLRADGDARDDPLLALLARSCPLWLDDFGAGGASLLALLSGRFEVIKVDRAAVDALGRTAAGCDLLVALRTLAGERGMRTVLEGVASAADLSRVRDCGAWALQGWLWPSVGLHALGRLPLSSPALAAGARPDAPDA